LLDDCLFADVGQQGHKAGAFDRVFDGSLEGGAIAAAFAAKEFTLAGAHLLKALHVFIIHESGPGAALFGAEPTTILPATSKLLANHSNPRRKSKSGEVL
jgi:hypothetical protein